jgi:hypothetical protein
MPRGGPALYRSRQNGYSPKLVSVFIEGEVSVKRARVPVTLVFDPSFDPIGYFWPVENSMVIFHLNEMREDISERMEKALKRDGAQSFVLATHEKFAKIRKIVVFNGHD